MALFSRKQAPKKESTKKQKTAATQTPTVAHRGHDLSQVLLKPRVTEKAVGQSGQNVYTFIVRRDATKHEVRDAVKAVFNVTPIRVNIVNKSPRQSHSRRLGRTISEKGMKKAYVQLKKGDTINLV